MSAFFQHRRAFYTSSEPDGLMEQAEAISDAL